MCNLRALVPDWNRLIGLWEKSPSEEVRAKMDRIALEISRLPNQTLECARVQIAAGFRRMGPDPDAINSSEPLHSYIAELLIEAGLKKLTKPNLRAVHSDAPFIFHSSSQDRKIVAVSDDWLTVLNYDLEEVIGRPVTDFMSDETRAISEDVILPALWSEGYWPYHPGCYLTKEGSPVSFKICAHVAGYDQEAYSRSMVYFQPV